MPAGRNRGAMPAVQESARRPAKTDFVMGFFDLFRKKQDTPADTAAGRLSKHSPNSGARS